MSVGHRFTLLFFGFLKGGDEKMKRYLTVGYLGGLVLMVAGLTFSSTGYGDDSSSSASSLAPGGGGSSMATLAPVEPTSKVFGTIDLRAEYYNGTAMFDTSNYAQLGYQFNPNFLVSWYQGFDSNIDNALLNNKSSTGLNAILDQGFLRTRVNKIWESADKSLAFNYENRVYVPTWGVDSMSGNIVQLYNAFKLTKKVNDTLTLTGVFVVKPEIYDVAGTAAFGPNPSYEQRYYLVADINITSKLSLDLPLLLYQTKYRDYGTTAKSGNWQYILYAWPELDYAITDTFTVGLAYVTANMVKPDLSGVTLGDAIKGATWQLVFTTNL